MFENGWQQLKLVENSWRPLKAVENGWGEGGVAKQGREGGLNNQMSWTGHVIWGPMRGQEINYMGRGHIYIYVHKYTYKQTSQLLDQISPVGRFVENLPFQQHPVINPWIPFRSSLSISGHVDGESTASSIHSLFQLFVYQWHGCKSAQEVHHTKSLPRQGGISSRKSLFLIQNFEVLALLW